ncbi:O-antigen ligase family protein [Ruficoccus amylovorans]|uniref:O-antigen ligase family protein n=1 Tax=Ruficoccus amylovorans TaxID=1804625 RepID=A0A842HIF1_9BACT|nr:O-antigen ligase family protein [Ruficoccus amylovorans]MBC2595297.1 O-antigen ligase family protein [Ruficoccus amylovorans]
MLEEEFPSPGPKTQGERAIQWHLVAFGLATALLFAGAAYFSQPYLGAFGWIGLVIYFWHSSELPDHNTHPLLTLSAYLLPFIVCLAVFITGLWNPPVMEVEEGGITYLLLHEVRSLSPVTTLPRDNWMAIFLAGGIYVSALNMLLVISAEDVARRILLILGIFATVLAAIGFLQAVLQSDRLLGFIYAPSGSYFSIFPHPHGWASFALLWTGAMIGLGSHYIRHMRLQTFLDRGGIWFIVATLVLAASVALTGTGLHLLCLSLLLGLAALDASYNTSSRKKFAKLVLGLGGFVILTGGIATFALYLPRATESLVHTNLIPSVGLSFQEQLLIYKDAWQLFLDKPVFGWGAGSFRTMMTFYQETELGTSVYQAAHSDALQVLVEYGLVGAFAWISVPALVFIRFLNLKTHRPLSWYLFGTCSLGLLLALVGFPFRFPAFAFSFLLLWFMAYRWSVIPHLKTSDILRPQLVFTDEGSRRRRSHARPPRPYK